jgi:hypothetical protein
MTTRQLSLNIHELDPEILDEEAIQDIWACDWEDVMCPGCGRNMDHHNAAQLTRCAR